MSYTNLRDFDPEYTATLDGYVVQIEKLGGGTVGNAYEGIWRYVVSAPDGTEILRGQDLHTGTPKTHAEVSFILADLIIGDAIYDYSHGAIFTEEEF